MADHSTFSPREIAECLRTTAAMLRTELTALPAPVSSWHPAPGEWCIKETLGHLIEAEQRGFAGRIRIILGSHDPQLAAWDQVALARERHDCDRDLAALLDEFTQLRDASFVLVARLQDTELERGGNHPAVGYMRIADLLYEWMYHDYNHVRQMLANVQSFVWPHLGNTQRFYQE